MLHRQVCRHRAGRGVSFEAPAQQRAGCPSVLDPPRTASALRRRVDPVRRPPGRPGPVRRPPGRRMGRRARSGGLRRLPRRVRYGRILLARVSVSSVGPAEDDTGSAMPCQSTIDTSAGLTVGAELGRVVAHHTPRQVSTRSTTPAAALARRVGRSRPPDSGGRDVAWDPRRERRVGSGSTSGPKSSSSASSTPPPEGEAASVPFARIGSPEGGSESTAGVATKGVPVPSTRLAGCGVVRGSVRGLCASRTSLTRSSASTAEVGESGDVTLAGGPGTSPLGSGRPGTPGRAAGSIDSPSEGSAEAGVRG